MITLLTTISFTVTGYIFFATLASGTNSPDPSIGRVKRILVTYHPPDGVRGLHSLLNQQATWVVDLRKNRTTGQVSWDNCDESLRLTHMTRVKRAVFPDADVSVTPPDSHSVDGRSVKIYYKLPGTRTPRRLLLTYPRDKPFPINSGPQDWTRYRLHCDNDRVWSRRYGHFQFDKTKLTLDDLDFLERNRDAEVALCRHLESMGLPRSEASGFLAADCPELREKHRQSHLRAKFLRSAARTSLRSRVWGFCLLCRGTKEYKLKTSRQTQRCPFCLGPWDKKSDNAT